MNEWQYLQPENEISVVIVTLLIGMFVVWLLLLTWQLWQLISHRGSIHRGEDVTQLAEAVRGRLLANGTEGDSILALPYAKETAESEFSKYCEANRINTNGPIGRHL